MDNILRFGFIPLFQLQNDTTMVKTSNVNCNASRTSILTLSVEFYYFVYSVVMFTFYCLRNVASTCNVL